MKEADLIPFQAAAELNVEMIMTAHVLYPSTDPLYPATLSSALVQGLLRGSMAYNGVIITDDLDMGAVADRYSEDEAALKALLAGVNILLICNHPEKAFRARSRIVQAMRDGEISQDRLRESLTRIHNLKALYSDSMQPCDQARVKEYYKIA